MPGEAGGLREVGGDAVDRSLLAGDRMPLAGRPKSESRRVLRTGIREGAREVVSAGLRSMSVSSLFERACDGLVPGRY